jgi:membrane protein implicated in regulation of membrane protease activity
MALLWLAAAIALLVLEVLTIAFFALFVMVGALAAALAAQSGQSVVVQVVVFAVVSAIGLVAARPPLMAYLRRRSHPATKSGAHAMIGKEVPVVDTIAGALQPGHVFVSGENWPAVSSDGSPIPAGSTVVVEGLRNATLVVHLKEPVAEASAPGISGSEEG